MENEILGILQRAQIAFSLLLGHVGDGTEFHSLPGHSYGSHFEYAHRRSRWHGCFFFCLGFLVKVLYPQDREPRRTAGIGVHTRIRI